MTVIAPRPLSAIRLVAPGFVLLLALSMTGCDQVQDMMGEREATDAVPADRSSVTTPRTTTTPAQQTGQATPAPPNAEQLLAEFRSLNSLRVSDEALKRVADVPAAASQIVDLDLSSDWNRWPGLAGQVSQFQDGQAFKHQTACRRFCWFQFAVDFHTSRTGELND